MARSLGAIHVPCGVLGDDGYRSVEVRDAAARYTNMEFDVLLYISWWSRGKGEGDTPTASNSC